MKKILFFAVLGALGTSLFTSCSNDDALEPPKPNDVIASEYADAFKARFGETTFNTVKSVNVTAQIPQGKGNYTLRVYDGYPSANSGAQMIGKFENLNAGSTLNKIVNCPGNAERLFFTAERNGLSMVSNCAIKNNKVVARFDEGSETYSGIDGTFKLDWSSDYAQFSRKFYDELPNALTSIEGLFNENDTHKSAGHDAYFFFNEEGKVVFYPIFMNELLNDHIGYFIYDTSNGTILEEGDLITKGTQEAPILWRGNSNGPDEQYPTYTPPSQGTGVQLNSNQFMYSKAFTITAPEGADLNSCVVGITVSNDEYKGVQYMYGETYYSISELNANKTAANAQVAVYAAGQIEYQNQTEEGVTITTGTFGLVGIEDNVTENSDWDMNDIVLYTEATQATSIAFEKPAKYFIAFEDLGGTYDFDFNDVVLEIDYVSGQGWGLVKCVAAGGTLPVEVYYDGPELELELRAAQDGYPLFGGEIHEQFEVDVTTVVNTIPKGVTVGLTGADKDPLVDEIYIGDDFNIADDAIPFYLIVDGNFEQGQKRINARGADGTPQAIVIGTTWTKYPGSWDEETQQWVEGSNVKQPEFTYWQWPIEKTAIDKAYPGISNWITNPENLNWLKTGKANLLFPLQ